MLLHWAIVTACVSAVATSTAWADPPCDPTGAPDTLVLRETTPLGVFDGVPYVRYDGIFEGSTGNGFFRVPYEISAPADPEEGNKTVWVEPSHFAARLGSLQVNLGQQFVFGRGFAHAGVGWSTRGRSILNATPGFDMCIAGQLVNPDGGVTGSLVEDGAIAAHLGAALVQDAEALRELGKIHHRYLIGLSQTSGVVRALLENGDAEQAGFDGALSYVNAGVPADPANLQAAMQSGVFTGKVIAVSTEFDYGCYHAPCTEPWDTTVPYIGFGFDAWSLQDDGSTARYRNYVVVGSAHVPDVGPGVSPTAHLSPATFEARLRAAAWQLHRWVTADRPPPPSTSFQLDDDHEIVRDGRGNALTITMDPDLGEEGTPVPRMPFVELGEAQYISGFGLVPPTGGYVDIQSVGDEGFYPTWDDYLDAFVHAAEAYKRAGYMLEEDETRMIERASLCPDSTYTENYENQYDHFVDLTPCP